MAEGNKTDENQGRSEIDANRPLAVHIETPRGSRNKYSFDEGSGRLQLKTVLPLGMSFPYDFGFVPGTMGGDGDPLDALVLCEEPLFPGCIVQVRLLGALVSEQVTPKGVYRNDRLIAAALPSPLYGGMHGLGQLPAGFRAEVESFFETYHRLRSKQARALGWIDAAGAWDLVRQGRLAKGG